MATESTSESVGKVRPQLMCYVAVPDVWELQQAMHSGMTAALIRADDHTREWQRDLVRAVRTAESRMSQQVAPTHVAIALAIRSHVTDDITFAVSLGTDLDAIVTDCGTVDHVSELRKQVAPDVLILVEMQDDNVDVDDEGLAAADGAVVPDSDSPAVTRCVQLCKSQAKLLIADATAEKLTLTAPDCLLSGVHCPIIREMWQQRALRGPIKAESVMMHVDTDDDLSVKSAFNMSANMESAKAIVAISWSGETVRKLVQFRPDVPVVAVVNSVRLARQMRLLHGVIPLFFDGDLHTPKWTMEEDERVDSATHLLKHLGIVATGQEIIVLTGPRPKCPTIPGAAISCSLTV